ncbi:MAG: response regulator [Deltaproteobacteria bacterium]|nr:MAG: response regulator [Deltaproteobacteria bacterium]
MVGTDKLDDMSLEDLEYTLVVDSRTSIMVVDDEDIIRLVFESLLQESGHELLMASCATEAFQLVERNPPDLLIVDKNLPDISGLELARQVKTRYRDTEFMVITGYASYDSAVEALRLGAIDYLEKPFNDLEVLEKKINRAIEHRLLQQENRLLAEQLREANRQLALAKDGVSGSGNRSGSFKRLELVSNLLGQAHQQLGMMAEQQRVKRSFVNGVRDILAEAWRVLQESMPRGEENHC